MNTLCVECGESVSAVEEVCSNCGTKNDLSNAETMVSDSDETLVSEDSLEQAETLESKTLIQSSVKAEITEGDLIGKTIGGAVVKKKIGKGGMGSVYLAHHLTLDIPVAIKFLKPEYAKRSPDAVERFLKEARAVAKLRHANIVSVYNAGFEEGFYFMSMEFINGRDLSEVLESPFQLSLKDALRLTCQVCDALHYAHENNIIHRDIKPANIFIAEDGSAKVGDLGLAKDLEDDQNITQPLQAMGTPYYISPEQATDAKEVDRRSDIYSLGCTFYRLFCGKVPFKGNSSLETVSKHLSEPVPDPLKENPEIPRKVAKVIQKMMAKKPEERFRDLDEVSDILRSELDNISDSKMGFAPRPDNTEKSGKKPLNLNLIIVAVIILAGLLYFKRGEEKIPSPLVDGVNSNAVYNEDSSQLKPAVIYNLARKQLDNGNYAVSMKLFEKFFKSNPDSIDAHLDFSVLLKQTEGIEAARERYRLWSEKTKNPSIALTHFLLMNRQSRSEAKGEFENTFPEFGPFFYYTSLQWKNQGMNQTLSEKMEEYRLLKKFHELDSKGKFLKYYIDREKVEEFRADAVERFKKLEHQKNLFKSPVTLSISFERAPQNPSVIIGESSKDRSTAMLRVGLSDYLNVEEILYKLEEMKDFKSTGENLLAGTGPKLTFPIPKNKNERDILIKYIDKKGEVNGPYKIKFNLKKAQSEQAKRIFSSLKGSLVMFRDYDKKLLFYFTTLLSAAQGLQEIRYSTDSDKLDKIHPFDENKPYDNVYTQLPYETKAVHLQLTFKDGTQSEIIEFKKPADLRKE